MIRQLSISLICLAVAAIAGQANADPLSRATQEFIEEFPAARFVDDGDPGRWYIVHGFASAKVAGDPAVAAEQFALGHRELFGLGHPQSGVELERVVRHRAHRYFQFEQTFDGLPVFEAMVIVQVDGQGRIVRVSSTAVPVPSAAEPAIDEADAAAAAQRGIIGLVGPPLDVDLGFLPGVGGAQLAYRVIAPGTDLHLWETYVDARSGVVALRFDRVRRHDALIFPENPIADSETTTQVFLPNIEPGEHENHTFGSLARVATCNDYDDWGYCIGWEHQAVADDNGFLDELPLLDDPTVSPDGFAEVNAYYHLDEHNQWMRDEFGYDGLYVDMETMTEEQHIWAHVGLDVANAFYMGGWGDEPDSVAFGQGTLYTDIVDFAYDADVIIHEFTHSVTDKAFNVRWGRRDELGFDASGGGVSEGTSDYFAVTRKDNSMLSEYALGESSRDLDNDNICPDDVWGESHHDGLIAGGAMWEIREALGAAKADHLDYGALASVQIRTFSQYAAALVTQAEAMQSEIGELQFSAADVALVEDVVAARGLEGCSRVVNLWDDGPIETVHYAGWDMTDGQGTPSAVQYLTPTFDDSAVLKLHVTPFADATYDVLVRRGQPVIYTWSDDGWPFSWEAEHDHMWTGPLTEAKISNITELALEPGEDYYFSIACRATAYGCYNSVTMSLSTEPEDDPDAGPDTDTDSDTDSDADAGPDAGVGKKSSGCGCRVSGDSALPVSLVELVLGLI
jgi:Zn-dependent metalloprotease